MELGGKTERTHRSAPRTPRIHCLRGVFFLIGCRARTPCLLKRTPGELDHQMAIGDIVKLIEEWGTAMFRVTPRCVDALIRCRQC